jgi:hypothetical protein
MPANAHACEMSTVARSAQRPIPSEPFGP